MQKKHIFWLIFIFPLALFARAPLFGDDAILHLPEAILFVSLAGNEGMVREILSLGVDIDVRTAHGDTALHLAMFQDNMTVLALLLEYGFDPDAGNRSGDTAMHRAVTTDNVAAVRMLLHYGADKNKRNLAGRTPLQEAQRSGNRREIVFLLM